MFLLGRGIPRPHRHGLVQASPSGRGKPIWTCQPYPSRADIGSELTRRDMVREAPNNSRHVDCEQAKLTIGEVVRVLHHHVIVGKIRHDVFRGAAVVLQKEVVVFLRHVHTAAVVTRRSKLFQSKQCGRRPVDLECSCCLYNPVPRSPSHRS